MQLCSLFNVNDYVSYAIYSKLDPSAKSAFACSSKDSQALIKRLTKMERKALWFAEFVHSNFKIVHSSLPLQELHRFVFYPCRILGLGEDHVRDEDRKINGSLVNILFSSEYHLRVECAHIHRSYYREANAGQLKYVAPNIKQKTKSWDINQTVIHELLNFTLVYIEFSKEILKLFDNYLIGSLAECIHIIHQYFSQKERISIFRLPISNYNKMNSPTLKDEKTTSLDIVERAFTALEQRLTELEDKFIKENKIREDHLENKIMRDIANFKHSTLFISGSLHLKTLLLRKKIITLYENKNIPLLFIYPKLKSRNSFSDPYSNQNLSLTEALKMLKAMENITQIQMKYLKKMIQEVDLERIDYDQNHFGAWQEVCEKVMKLQLFYLRF